MAGLRLLGRYHRVVPDGPSVPASRAPTSAEFHWLNQGVAKVRENPYADVSAINGIDCQLRHVLDKMLITSDNSLCIRLPQTHRQRAPRWDIWEGTSPCRKRLYC